MFGGYFGGEDGETHTLKSGDEEIAQADGTFKVTRGKETLAEGLTVGPIEAIATALRTIGYGIDEPLVTSPVQKHVAGKMDRVLVFCIAQFVRRFCCGSRQRPDQLAAYNEVNVRKNTPSVFVDAGLARLIRRAEIAAIDEG